ncbi:helix-turn-helix domain-containing protein [Francisella tularensis subsp. novicida]|uniref:IclR family transcriptional regulator n=1 Tax=Francisella tularensis TaxID=263 RepID=UPI000158B04B|nr:helix-turn-helix domain-containing protein [Francisella tularensis]AJI44804.1 bacterial transcriptional regulator family protein [Francisella tularensis subsp. novicida F6168]AJJ47636.1 iclR helix-turn-helix domain protein [Francisella tularensis subsp. novicida]APC99078.1 iclR helix-turn-helix domain protein [Francisella tularensis subsp. novicida]EDN36064.1 transcriptional regulator [Francisella tularensis subsp. novicida GA99-3549]KFJ68860.1 bacterial transcriptional regulator family pro
MSEDKRIQVISRAVNVLKSIGSKPDGMSLGEIAKQIYLPRSTVQRIVAALEEEGFIRSEGAGKILLGPGIFKLISSCYVDIITLTQDSLSKLSEKVQETVSLTQSYDKNLLVLHRFVVNREIQIIPRVGALTPIHKTAAGRALLALHTDDKIIETLGEQVADDKELFEKIAKIRVEGIDIDYSEVVKGIVAIGVAIKTFLGDFGIAILAPQHRFDQNKDFYVDELLKVKSKIIDEIGV